MKANVFLRSTLRQPVKTVLLLLITALVSFGLIAQVAQYLLIRQEVEQLEGYYRSVGTLKSTSGEVLADAGTFAPYLEENPYVEYVDLVHGVSAVADIYNAQTTIDPQYMNEDIFFYGTLNGMSSRDYGWRSDGSPNITFDLVFTVDTVAAGYPEYISEGSSIVLHSPLRSITEYSAETVYGVKRTETVMWSAYTDLTSVCGEMEVGGRYLMHAVNGYSYSILDPTVSATYLVCIFEPLIENGPWYYPVAEGTADLSDPKLAGVKELIDLVNENQHALLFLGSEDVSALPQVQGDNGDAFLLPDMYLLEGRWPDRQDTAQGNRVCAVDARLASERGLTVGDTITVTFRNISGDFTPFLTLPGTMTTMDTGSGFLRCRNVIDDYQLLLSMRRRMETTEEEAFEIVGLYDSNDTPGLRNDYVYAPVSVLPTFGNTLQSTFLLTSPEYENQFIVDTRKTFASMDLLVDFLDTNWDDFQAVARPMVRSSLYNALIFSAAFAAALCLAVFLYFRMRRKDLAIARALGLPAGRCVRQVSFPLLLIGLTGIVCGSLPGWQYARQNAATLLSALSALVWDTGTADAALSPVWLVLLFGAAFALLLALTLGSAFLAAGRPVLNQLQGGAAAKKKQAKALPEQTADPVRSSVSAPVVRAVPSAAPVSGRGIGAGMVLRFVRRQIVRSKLKSALSILLAAVFTVALAAIRFSIESNFEKIDRLYENTRVEADLYLANASYTLLGSGYIRAGTIDALLESGYILDAYLEGARQVTAIRSNPATGAEVSERVYIRSLNDVDRFLSDSGSGDGVSITYLDGWDDSLFQKDWSEGDGPMPAILPQSVKYVWNLGGSTFEMTCGNRKTFVAAGYYEGRVTDVSGNATFPILLPLSAHRVLLGGGNMVYARARVTLDPSLNRELDMVEATVTEITGRQGTVRLNAVIWDQELEMAVSQLENSVELMQVLYPVTLGLSLLAAAGIAALFIMTSAKEAAILRVLGTTKLRSRVMLSLQQTFTTTIGLLVGISVALAWSRAVRPELLGNLMGASALCAALYLLAAVIGAAASSAAATGKNPLELLQVKE